MLQRYAGDRQVVLVGDLVAKGPDSAGVIALARASKALGVLGNHDARALRYLQSPDGREFAGRDNGFYERFTEGDWDYLRQLPPFLRLDEGRLLVVHAGLAPGQPVDTQPVDRLTHLRSIRPDGSYSFSSQDGVPWASRWVGPPTVVFGHDARRGLQRYGRAVGLDTGCVYGKELTGLLWPEGTLVQVPARDVYKRVGP